MKFSKIAMVVVIITVVVFLIPAVKNNFWRADTPDQIKNAKEFYEHEALLKTPICHDNFTMTIASVTLSIPRTGFGTYTLKNGQKLSDMSHHCEIKHLDDVVSARWPNMTLYDSRINKEEKIFFYERYASEIKNFRLKNQVVKLSNGIEKSQSVTSVMYIIPANLISTYNKQPVVFECLTGAKGEFEGAADCQTNYLYKKNLGLWYRYFATNYGLEDQRLADQNNRKILENMTVRKK